AQSFVRSGPTGPAHPANRTRPPTAPLLAPAAVPATPAGYGAPLRRSDPAPLIQRNAEDRAQQLARVTISQTSDKQLGQSPELLARPARPEHRHHRLRQQPPHHE